MFKKRMNSIKKNMAILVSVAFISAVLPEVTHAAPRSSSTEFLFSEKSFPLFSPVFFFVSLNFPLTVYDLATLYTLSNNRGKIRPKPFPKPFPRPANKTGEKNSNMNNGTIKSQDNSTSKKPPKPKD